MGHILLSYMKIAVVLGLLQCSLSLEFNKNRQNSNTDFLAHETQGSLGGPKRDYVAPLNNNDYNSQFPSLGSPSTTAHTTPRPVTITQPVTSQLPARKHQSTVLRDYVAPQSPSSKGPPTTSNQNLPGPQLPIQKPQTTGKRDYVSPQFTTRKPVTGTTGNVKSLINFYDKKPLNQNTNNNSPSYSYIAQNNKNFGAATHAVNAPVTAPTTQKSFSSIVAGSNRLGSTTPVSNTNPKPLSQGFSTPVKPSPNNFTPTSQTGSPVLPSSLVGNKNSNPGNANSPSDLELQTISEELLRKDTNNAAKYVTVNYQQKTSSQSSDDKAPQPLLTITPEVWNIPTIQKLVPLLDNYERDTSINEYVTAQERNEENAFMDAIMNTAVIRHLMTFLKEKGYVSLDPKQQRDYLKQIWFNLYSRGKGKISSSGFEHVFVSELKHGDVQGLHNWVYFSKEESVNRLNYLGYLKYEKLDDKGAVLKLHFNQQGIDKPVGTMFIGTSPELEIALYSLCFVTRADNDCKLKLASKDVEIVTHTFRYRSKNFIGSAYPRI